MSLDTLFAMLTSYSGLDNSLVSVQEWDLEESNTYNIDGARMTTDIDSRIPIVYGRHLCPTKMINYFVEEGENETLAMLLGVCEGEIESLSNIKVNNSPIEKYYGEDANDPYGENAEITVKKGTVGQEPIEGFNDIHLVQPIDQELSQGTPWEYTLSITTAEAFKITFTIDSLYQTNDADAILSWYVSLQIEYRQVGDTTWIHAGIHDFNKKTQSVFQRYFKSEYLTAGEYEVRVTKVSEDPDSTHFGVVTIQEIDEIRTQNLSYPSTACLGIRLITTEAIKNVTCIVTGTKVRIPDVRDYSGNRIPWEDYYYDGTEEVFKRLSNNGRLEWDSTYYIGWSGNNAWCLRDMLLAKRYGLGKWITSSDLNEASFLSSALYCEEGVLGLNGKMEKRMRVDIVLDVPKSAPESIYTLCNTFRCIPDFSSNKVRIIIEKAETETFLFNTTSIVPNSFTIDYISDKAIPNVLNFVYANKDKEYKRDTYPLTDIASIQAGDALKERDFQFIGISRVSQILREGRILLNKLKTNITPISFTTSYEAFTAQKGDVFKFQHDLPGWGEGGRCAIGSTSTNIMLDKGVSLDAGRTYDITIQHLATDVVETKTITTTWGSHTEVVSGAFSFVPDKYDKWDIYIQGTDKKFRVAKIARKFNGTIDVAAVNYDADNYDPTNIDTPEDEFKYITLEIPLVTNLKAVEQATLLTDGTIDDVILVSYLRPVQSSRYVKVPRDFEVHISDDNGISWEFIAKTDKETVTIKQPFEVDRRYTIAVATVTTDGERTVPATSPQYSVTIEGWRKPPAIVTGFTYTFKDEIKLDWEKNAETNVAGYEIRTNNDNWGSLDSDFIWRGQTNSYTIVRPEARGGIAYYIRAYNTNTVYSDSSVEVTPINPAPEAPTLISSDLFQKVFLAWDDSTDVDLVGYQVWQNSSNVWTGEEDGDETLINKAQGTSVVLPVPFDPTYFRTRAYDKFGVGNWSNVVLVNKLQLDGASLGDGIINTVHIGDDTITTPKLVAGAITAGKIAALAVIAEKIDVAELSAISADLGYINAGTIIGACIKTSEQDHRTELNNAGLSSYDADGNLAIKLQDGQLCLIDPLNPDFYSCLDAGALTFHTPYDTVPYLKRIESGTADAGGTITLCRWYEQPQVTVGINRLTSYDVSACASNQEWCLYYDNLVQFDNGGADFGWTFDVHSKLVVAGGSYDEIIYLDAFDVCECTHDATCQILVKDMFQLWCHSDAPDTYKYGTMCYEVRYRCLGCGVWCGTCFSYTQPHSSEARIKETNIICHTMNLTTGNCWEVSMHCVSLAYSNSGIVSGSSATCLCCYTYPVDCSYYTLCTLYSNKPFNLCQCSGQLHKCLEDYKKVLDTSTAYGNWDNNQHPVCESIITAYVKDGQYDLKSSSAIWSTCAYVCAVACYSGDTFFSDWRCVVERERYCCVFASGIVPTWVVCSTWKTKCFQECYESYVCIDLAVVWPSIGTYTSIGINLACFYGSVDTCQQICYKQCCVCNCICCYWYTCACGTPDSCVYYKYYSMTDTIDTETVLDGSGLINYLALSYS